MGKMSVWRIAQRQEKFICIWIDYFIMNFLYNGINPKDSSS